MHRAGYCSLLAQSWPVLINASRWLLPVVVVASAALAAAAVVLNQLELRLPLVHFRQSAPQVFLFAVAAIMHACRYSCIARPVLLGLFRPMSIGYLQHGNAARDVLACPLSCKLRLLRGQWLIHRLASSSQSSFSDTAEVPRAGGDDPLDNTSPARCVKVR